MSSISDKSNVTLMNEMTDLLKRLNDMNKEELLQIVPDLVSIAKRRLLSSDDVPSTNLSIPLNVDSILMTAGWTVLSMEFL